MKKLFVFLFLVLVVASPVSAQSGKVSCPIVASRDSGEFQSLSRSGFTCFKNSKAARSAGYFRGNAGVGSSGFATEPFFSLDGLGDANSPAFQVRRFSAVIHYTYAGTGDFNMDLVDRKTGRLVERMVRSRGPLDATTYVNRSGVFYLRISGDNRIVNGQVVEGDWSVDLDIPE